MVVMVMVMVMVMTTFRVAECQGAQSAKVPNRRIEA